MYLNMIFFTLEFPLFWLCITLGLSTLIVVCLCIYGQQSKSNGPPGGHGLPLIGETIQFIVGARTSSRGFYDFVQTRCLR